MTRTLQHPQEVPWSFGMAAFFACAVHLFKKTSQANAVAGSSTLEVDGRVIAGVMPSRAAERPCLRTTKPTETTTGDTKANFQVGWPLSGGVAPSVRWDGPCLSGGVAPVCQVGWPVCQVGWPHLTTSAAEAVENEHAVSHAGYRWPHSRSPTSPTLVCQCVMCFVSCLRKAVHCLPQKTCSLVI